MSDDSDNGSRIYPSANIVVGVGRVGLAVLERLGERWHELQAASTDPSLSNLRLMHVRPDDDGRGMRWRQQEREYVRIAKYSGDDDLPSRALDFVILRSLGIVRFRDGAYQVAMPRDEGVVDGGRGEASARRRYFEWTHLHPDPVGAAERLSQADDELPDLKRFADPLFNRVKLGHSPKAILAIVSRCRALSEGRDPSPWRWVFDLMREREGPPDLEDDFWTIPFREDWLGEADRRGVLENFAEPPIDGWEAWWEERFSGRAEAGAKGRGGRAPSDVSVPSPFVPKPRDLEAPLEPMELLEGDWEKAGWAHEGPETNRHAPYRPADVGAFRLGLFDHDASSEVQKSRQGQFAERLRELGREAHRGLVRLWVDLQRNRVASDADRESASRRRGESSESRRQSLELLGELVVRPVADGELDDDPLESFEEEVDQLELASREDDWIERGDFPLDPSDRLRRSTLDQQTEADETARALWDRLDALGFSSEADSLPERQLFRQITWTPEDALADREEGGGGAGDGSERPGALEFRSALNEEVRHLFHFDHLQEIREEASSRPPRLNVYVVADVGEPFCRASTRSVLRDVHAELLKAYGPLFESFREGMNRTLAIHPVLWSPHPSDAFGGGHPVENQCEEAAIIESVQGIRRWVESIPDETRRIPNIFVNGRVTDSAVLSRRQAVDETYNFLSLRIRNRLTDDPWLRRMASGAGGPDLFASFSCHQVEFPAHTAREYLANRLARDSLRELERGADSPEAPTFALEALDPPAPDELEGEGRERLRAFTHQEAETCASEVETRLRPDFWTTSEAIESGFDGAFERELVERIHDRWRELTREQGTMDEVVDDLRRRSAAEVDELLSDVEEVGDELIAEYAAKGDLGAAEAGFNDLTRVAGDWLRDAEQGRQRGERDCVDNHEPSMEEVRERRREVEDRAPEKPDGRAMATGMAAWLLMAPALGAPLCWALASYLGLPSAPGPLEFALGPLGYLTGGLAVFAVGAFLMYRHMQQIVEEIEEAIDGLAEAVRGVVHGSGEGLDASTSIRSFVEARFGHAAKASIRNGAQRAYEAIVRDDALARRIYRSVDIQRRRLARHAERLGAHASSDASEAGEGDDLSDLFSEGVLRDRRSLLHPDQLLEYYRSRIGTRLQIRRSLPDFIERTGGLSGWRRTAVMADEERLLGYGRDLFEELVERPVADQMAFGDSAGDRIVEFVEDVYSNMGFGAKFTGFEGLDPDGIDVVADRTLVLHPELRGVFERARERRNVVAATETLDVVETAVDPNSAFMLSLAAGIRPHSIRNFARHESYTDREAMPDDRTFPLSGEPPAPQSETLINHLTGHDDLRESIHDGMEEEPKATTSPDWSVPAPSASGSADDGGSGGPDGTESTGDSDPDEEGGDAD